MIEQQIFEEIQKAKSILLHLHVSPDCDSQGSVLAMAEALTMLGKKVTVIKGDSDVQASMAHLPGADVIIHKNFLEIDQKDFDLFIILDSASMDRISNIKPFKFDEHLMTIVIDHHVSNTGFGKINLIDTKAPATALLLFRLFKKWNVSITNTMARNLLLGLYTDTGCLTYTNTTSEALLMAAELFPNAPEFSKDLAKVTTISLETLRFEGLAFKNIELHGGIALSTVSYDELQKEKIHPDHTSASLISDILKNVQDIKAAGCLVEDDPGKIKGSFRSKDGEQYDVSQITLALGGGGHKAAAGVMIHGTMDEVKARVLSTINDYNSRT